MELLIIYYQVLKGGCQRKLLNEENKYLINPLLDYLLLFVVTLF